MPVSFLPLPFVSCSFYPGTQHLFCIFSAFRPISYIAVLRSFCLRSYPLLYLTSLILRTSLYSFFRLAEFSPESLETLSKGRGNAQDAKTPFLLRFFLAARQAHLLVAIVWVLPPSHLHYLPPLRSKRLYFLPGPNACACMFASFHCCPMFFSVGMLSVGLSW
eukprot:RCo024266